VVIVSGAILLLALSNLVVRYASSRFPSEKSDSPSSVRRRFVTSKEKSAATAE